MFRFVRSIRQPLLAKNKTLKYLKYAVGAVVVVAIGMLIALIASHGDFFYKVGLVNFP